MIDSTYEMRFRFQVYYPGTPQEHRILLPDEVDLAVLNLQIASQEEEIARLQAQPYPPEIQEIRQRPEGEPRTPEETSRLASFATLRLAEQESWGTALYRTRKRLEQALKLIDGAPDPRAIAEERCFVFRDFEYEEQLDAEDEHTVLRQGRLELDRGRRNAQLFRLCLLGEQKYGERIPVDWEHHALPSKLVQVGIERQWARAEMSPELADHFRGRG